MLRSASVVARWPGQEEKGEHFGLERWQKGERFGRLKRADPGRG